MTPVPASSGGDAPIAPPPPSPPATVEAFYERERARPTAIAPHLPRLRALADGLDLAVEFGVKRGASSSALLLGAKRVISYDIVPTHDAKVLQRLAGARWQYLIQDSRTATIPPAGLIFFDSLHTYAQLDAELKAHAGKARRFLVFHDVGTFGEVGADGETGRQLWAYQPGFSVPVDCLGLRPAIDALMIRDRSWRVAARYVDSHGLLVLERNS